MKVSLVSILLLVGKLGVSSFALARDAPAFEPNSLRKFSTIHKPQLPRHLKRSTLHSSTSATEKKSGNETIIPASIAVGTITAAMGFLYGKVLGLSVKTIWSTIPTLLIKKVGTSLNPTIMITSICTLGGLLMGILSSKLSSIFAVSDFVSAFSRAPADTLPSSRIHLLPLLLLSLVTSSFGFSVGPEAPMVCAGALLGASLARIWYKEEDSKHNQETLAYAGAAGALTAFMGIPIAGSIFALELTRSNAGITKAGDQALSPSIIASVAALALIRGFLLPSKAVGGHFAYGSVGTLSGRAMMTTSVVCGAGGALIGTVFHKFVTSLKHAAWPSKESSKKRQILIKTIIGFLVGIISSNYPQTLFWGEGSLQCMVDGQASAFAATKHGLSNFLTSAARVNPSLPFAGAAPAFQVGAAKLLAIALACAGKFPGGIIFPLFFAAAPLAHGSIMALGMQQVLPVAVMCLMAATQSSVTRTPLATALILSLTSSASTELSVMLPACLVSSYLGVYLSRQFSRNSYFQYHE
jgi:H+/Cl- antiporter ClcA